MHHPSSLGKHQFLQNSNFLGAGGRFPKARRGRGFAVSFITISEPRWAPRKNIPVLVRLKSARRSQAHVFVQNPSTEARTHPAVGGVCLVGHEKSNNAGTVVTAPKPGGAPQFAHTHTHKKRRNATQYAHRPARHAERNGGAHVGARFFFAEAHAANA